MRCETLAGSLLSDDRITTRRSLLANPSHAALYLFDVCLVALIDCLLRRYQLAPGERRPLLAEGRLGPTPAPKNRFGFGGAEGVRKLCRNMMRMYRSPGLFRLCEVRMPLSYQRERTVQNKGDDRGSDRPTSRRNHRRRNAYWRAYAFG